MNHSTKKSKLGRALALSLSAAMIGALALVGAAPAVAVPGAYAVSGEVNTPDGAGFVALAGASASITILDPGYSDTVISDSTAADGSFSLPDLQPGFYTVEFEFAGYEPESVDVEVIDADVTLGAPVTMTPVPEQLSAGTVAITGTPVVGNVLTVVTNGWPVGATLTYEWFYSCGQCGGAIDGETATSYTVTDSLVSYWVGVRVTGAMVGYSNVSVNAILDTQTSAPKKSPAPAPTDLAGYLQANGSTPQAQTSTGLAAGALNPGTTQTANVTWTSQDSFVDVYAFSTPVFVGTFPVVNGVAQVTLSPAVLAQLAAGTHTLVVTGQSSGAVQSVTLAIGLPATGSDPTVPVAVASLLMLLGAGLMFVRRRYGARV